MDQLIGTYVCKGNRYTVTLSTCGKFGSSSTKSVHPSKFSGVKGGCTTFRMENLTDKITDKYFAQ